MHARRREAGQIVWDRAGWKSYYELAMEKQWFGPTFKEMFYGDFQDLVERVSIYNASKI